MIQRIQSAYLLLIAVCMVVMMSLPVVTFLDQTGTTTMNNLSLIRNDVVDYSPWALFAILFVVAVLALVTIFLYRKRMLQIRLCLFMILLLVGYYATLGAFVFLMNVPHAIAIVPSWTVCLPFVSIIAAWLAIRGIGKDEMLVKALDRLR